MRKKYKLKREFKKLLILFLGIALATQLVGNSVVFAMNDGADIIATYEVGVEGNNVIATLTKDGTMTLSGTGDIKDYTSDTMPFQDNISNIKDIIIEEGITSIGNALFYNCKDITGKLIIPSTVVEIGDYAFAGDSYESAPKITKIENSFTQSNIVVETPVEKKVEDSATEKSTEEQVAPAVEEAATDITSQDDTTKQEEQPVQETVKTVKSITEQQIGKNIFVQEQNGGYSCAETNKSFINAVEEVGYVRADRFVLVKMDESITQEVPVIEGQLVLPSKPDTLGVPAEDALTTYQFAGWTVEGSDNVLNPKDNYSISDDVEELNLTSQWQQTWKINPQVKAEAKEDTSIYSVVDSNTGKVLENVDGYTMSVQWQINKKDKEDEQAWENIENATSFTYERKAEVGDTKSYFRAKVSITKQSNFRSLPQSEIMTTNAVSGVSATNPITVIYNANGGSGIMTPEDYGENSKFIPSDSSFIAPSNKTFTGWKVTSISNVKAIYPSGSKELKVGDIIKPNIIFYTLSLIDGNSVGSLSLEAQWSDFTVIYVNASTGDDSRDGLSEANAVKNLQKAYDLLPEDGAVETNIIELAENTTTVFSGNSGNIWADKTLAGKNATIRGHGKSSILESDGLGGYDNPTSGQRTIGIQGDTVFENLEFNLHSSPITYLTCNGYNFTIKENVTMGDCYGIRDKGGYGAPANKYKPLQVFGTRNDSIGNIGPRGMSIDDPITITINGDVSVSRLVAGGRSSKFIGTLDNPLYANINLNKGDYGIIGAGSVNDTVYSVSTINLNNITAARVVGANLGDKDKLFYGKSTINVVDSTIEYLCNAGLGRIYPSTNWSNGDFVTNVYSGNITSLYGGASATKVNGDCTLNIYGGQIQNVYGGGHGYNDLITNWSDYLGIINGNVNINMFGGTINGDLYAGGQGYRYANSAVITGNVSLKINGGIIKGNVYGGGQGISGTTAAQINGDSSLSIEGGKIYGSVFGGGNLSYIDGNSNINLKNSKIGDVSVNGSGNVFGGGNNIGVKTSNISITEHNEILGSVYGGGNTSGTTTESIVNINGAVNTDVYGGGNGAGTIVTTSTVNIENAANITGDVFGGGELGAVETSNVNLKGGTIAGKVFGGGNNVGVTTSNVNIINSVNLTQEDGAVFGGSNAKGTTNASNITIDSGVRKNIYGGGLGAETTVGQSIVKFTGNADTSGQVYGGGKEGTVTDVEMNLSGQANDVFGGGHFVGIENSVNIVTKSGSYAANIYGGSNENGTVKNPTVTVEGGAGNVYGAGKGAGTTTESPTVTLNGMDTIVSGAVYGGGEQGVSNGLAKVLITNGATNIENVYGAGNDAGVQGNTEVIVGNDTSVSYVYGGSNNTGEVTGKATVKISGTTTGDVFGGGKGANTIVNSSYVETSSTASVGQNVFGGSDQGIIIGDTEMQIEGIISDSIYGAGKGETSNVMGNTHVVLFGATVTKDVFGGGNKGGIAGDSHVDLLSGTVKGSAFGGSNQAKVQGNSKVHMGLQATDNQKKPTNMKMIVEKSIFGGGNTTDSGKAFDASNPFVLGDSEVLINQKDYDDSNFSIGESILGDGNMCVTAGNKTISISGYSPRNGKKTLTSIQRATTLTIKSSIIELTGSMDSANLLPTKLYSMSRIDTIKMEGEVDLYFQKEVNLVRNLESYTLSGSLADSGSAMEAGGNILNLQQGTGFELRTNEDVSRPGYGNVKGYTQLNRYDTEGKPLVDGVYVLGGYDRTNTNYGFVFGADVFEIKGSNNVQVNNRGDVIIPESDDKSWNNWRLGRRVDVRTITLVASDRPSYGKTIGVESTWAADGSIYRIDKDSLRIENQNNSNEGFTLVSPDSLSTQKGINNTFGLEISTGQNGWLEQKNVGYIEGSTTGSGNEMVLQEKNDMIAVNDSKVQPLINVTLSNLTGITTKDVSSPLLVTFDINTYTKQADGTEMKTGTMTIKVNIIRDTAETYSDTTIEAGKNYRGAIQTYEYGTEHTSGLTISQSSSITTQFARKASSGTLAPTRHELNFNNTVLPVGTKILMIDRSMNDTKYYHYEAITEVSKIALSDFIANDSTDGKYTPITNGSSAENYIFIIDFEGVPSFTQKDIDMSLTAYNGNTSISKKHIVFSVSGSQRIYTLSSLKNDEKTYTPYSIGSTISVDLATSVNVTGLDGIDTTGRDKQMGARVRLYSVDNDSYINIPSTWEVISQGTHYAAGGNNFTINLADGLTVTNSNIYIQMSSIGNLPIGKYRLDIDLISGALANYPEDDTALAKNTIKIGIDLKDYSYSIKSTMADKNRQLFSNTDPIKNVDIKLEKTTSAGASTTGVYVRQTLYKKNEDNGMYESVNLDVLFDPSTLPLVNNKLAWDKNILNYKYKDNISAGTYRLQFDVMQADAFNDLAKAEDIVRATDTINIVVTDD